MEPIEGHWFIHSEEAANLLRFKLPSEIDRIPFQRSQRVATHLEWSDNELN